MFELISKLCTMTENPPDMSIRKLTGLIIVVEGKQCRFSVRKSSKQSVEEFLSKVRSEFVRRVSACSSLSYFSVLGYPNLEDSTIDDIFAELFLIAYENEDDWTLARDPTDKLTGVIVLNAPQDTQHTDHRNAPANTANKKTCRLASKVRFRDIFHRKSASNLVVVTSHAHTRRFTCHDGTHAEKTMNEAFQMYMPRITVEAFIYIIIHVSVAVIVKTPSLCIGAVMSHTIRNLLKSKYIKAWTLPDNIDDTDVRPLAAPCPIAGYDLYLCRRVCTIW